MNWLADKIEQWPTAKLLPYARNARTHSDDQVAQIAASIAEFGFTNPILAGSDGIIVAGHGRLAAAQKLGLEIVPVVVLDHLSPTQRRALGSAEQIASFQSQASVAHFLSNARTQNASFRRFLPEFLRFRPSPGHGGRTLPLRWPSAARVADTNLPSPPTC